MQTTIGGLRTCAEARHDGEASEMSQAAARSIESLTPAWRELETRTPVKLRAIESEKHYRAMLGFMEGLLDEIGDRESHPLMGLLDIATALVHEYEERNVEI